MIQGVLYLLGVVTYIKSHVDQGAARSPSIPAIHSSHNLGCYLFALLLRIGRLIDFTDM